MKKKRLIIAVIVILLFIMIISLILFFNKKDSNSKINVTYSKTVQEKYEYLNDKKSSDGYTYPEVNLNNEITFKHCKQETLENDMGLVFIGNYKDPKSRNAINVLRYVNTSVVYYIDANKNNELKELLLNLNEEFVIDDKINKPILLAINNGKVLAYHIGVPINDGQSEYDLLDNKQKSDLKLIYDEINTNASDDTCGMEPSDGC